MDIRSLANGAIQVVNPDLVVSVQRSTGFTIAAGRRQVGTYADAVEGPGQIQALDGSELKHVEGLNIQGVYRAIYLKGNLAAVVRPDEKGGDLVTIVDNRGSAAVAIGDQFLVVKVLESWPSWTKAAIVYQGKANA